MSKTEAVFGAHRSNDPDTAVEAAKADVSDLLQAVLNYLKENGPSTTEEISINSGIHLVSISPRMVQLETRGLARRTDQRRGGISGRPKIVWEAL
jgi:predicted ArsR family transcriptional regulator